MKPTNLPHAIAFLSRILLASTALLPILVAFAPAFTPRTAAAEVVILCDGQTYDGYTATPFFIDGAPGSEAMDPAKQKVIRNCVFRNSNLLAIRILNADNVLIENSTFENIRSLEAGRDLNAIGIPCLNAQCQVNNVVIRNNRFHNIGSDGVHVGTFGRYITNVRIEGNTFTTSPGVGENAIDIKGVLGPIRVTGNVIHGFRPCAFDCSGSAGEGIVIHGRDGPPQNITVERNRIFDNSIGVLVAPGSMPYPPVNIAIQNNWIHDNLAYGVQARQTLGLKVFNNTFVDNGQHVAVQDVDAVAGSSCALGNNLLAGIGGSPALVNSSACSNADVSVFGVAEAGFVNPSIGDFHLTAGSPAVDLGVDLRPDVTLDIDGQTRPIGPAFDLGADEADLSPTATPTPTANPTRTPSPTATPTHTGGATSPPPTADASALSVSASADTTVRKRNASANYGSSARLDADGSPIVRSLIRFNVAGIPLGATVQSARLRLFVVAGSNASGSLRAVQGGWGEATTTYRNAPALGTKIADLPGPAAPGTWKEVDVSSFVTGNGTFNFYLVTSSGDAVGYRSREGGTERPTLIVDW